jgi:hypothetical protein
LCGKMKAEGGWWWRPQLLTNAQLTFNRNALCLHEWHILKWVVWLKACVPSQALKHEMPDHIFSSTATPPKKPVAYTDLQHFLHSYLGPLQVLLQLRSSHKATCGL